MLVKLLNDVVLLKVVTHKGEEIFFNNGEGLKIGTADTAVEELKLQEMFEDMNKGYKEYYWK